MYTIFDKIQINLYLTKKLKIEKSLTLSLTAQIVLE